MLIIPKLHIPPLRTQMLPRTDLRHRLTTGRESRLLFVNGPAGSGKTSLACQWLAGIRSPLAWYALDDSDNTIDVFLRYFLTALGMAERRLATEFEPLVQGHKPLAGPAIMPHLTLCLSRLKRDIFIVLDDYHCITIPSIHELLQQLFSLTLPRIHFIVLSRRALPFSISRMKVRNQVLEISSQEMKISHAETRAFFKEIMPVDLSSDQLEQLSDRMEGWLGGLQLLGLSLQGRQSPADMSDVLDKASLEAADYLIDEVLDTQPEKVKSFIYATALLERFNVELCRRVGDPDDDAAGMLEQVYAGNLFLTSLDAERTWYRYHHLFAQAVRRRAFGQDAAMCQETCRKAALWFAGQGYLEDAFRQAFAACDMEFTADLLEDILLVVSDHYEMAFSHRWLSGLPRDIFAHRIFLRLQDCRLKLQLAELSEVSAILADIEQHWDEVPQRYQGPKRKLCEDYLLLLKRILPYWFDPENVDTRTLEEALQQIAPDNRALSVFHTVLPFSQYYKGDLVAAQRSLQQVHEKVFASGSHIAIMIWFRVAATVERLRGGMHRAEAIIYQALRFSGDLDSPHIPLRFMVDLPMAWICYQRNDLDSARAYAETVLKYVEQTRFFYEIVDVNYLLSLIYAAGGETRRADHCMQRMQYAAGVIATPGLIALADARAARLSLIQRRPEQADGWLKDRKLSIEEPFSFRFAFESQVAAEVLFAQERFPAAAQVLESLRKRCRTHQMMESVLEIDVLRAVIHYTLGDRRQAQRIMHAALMFAQPLGYVRPFVDHLRSISPLLAMAPATVEISTEANFLEAVSKACGIDPQPTGDDTAMPLAGHLTRREADILSLMAHGYTNQQIAEKTFISLYTVKTHARNIFEKLHVKTRGQAVSRAREMKLLRD